MSYLLRTPALLCKVIVTLFARVASLRELSETSWTVPTVVVCSTVGAARTAVDAERRR